MLSIRRTELVPRIAGIRGTDAAFERLGSRGLCARFHLNDGMVLSLDANFGAHEQSGYAPLQGRHVVFSTHDPAYGEGQAPPWSVRWTLA